MKTVLASTRIDAVLFLNQKLNAQIIHLTKLLI